MKRAERRRGRNQKKGSSVGCDSDDLHGSRETTNSDVSFHAPGQHYTACATAVKASRVRMHGVRGPYLGATRGPIECP